MGHYRSEMMPEANEKSVALYRKYRKIQEELKTVPIGAMTILELALVQKFITHRYQDYELNTPFVATSIADEIKSMQKIIKKCFP